MVEDSFGLLVFDDAHARDDIEHVEVSNDSFSELNRLGVFCARVGVGIELSDSLLESLDTLKQGDASIVFFEESLDFILNILYESGVKVCLGLLVKLIKSFFNFLQLSSVNMHVVVLVNVVEYGPGLFSRGDAQARDRGGGTLDTGGGKVGYRFHPLLFKCVIKS